MAVQLYSATAPIKALAGTEASPGITFTGGDRDTGIYSPAANQLGITTGGTSKLIIDENGSLQVVGGTKDNPAIYFDGGTGIYSPGADQVAISTNGTGRVIVATSEVVFNDAGEDYDFRIEGDTKANLLFVDASTDRVGFGTTSPAVECDVVGQVRASTGILFGSDTAAANALDDYEEGTFTPAIEGTTSSGTGTYSAQLGRYVKIGKQVTVWMRLTWSAHTGTGNAKVIGLPFQSQEITGGHHLVAATIGYEVNYDVAANTVLSAYVEPNSTRISLAQVGVGTQSGAGLAALDTAAGVTISATYETA